MARFRFLALFLVALSAITLTAGCRHRWAEHHHEKIMQQRIAEAEQAIREATIESTKAAQAKDLDKTVSYYAPNAIMFGLGAPIQGTENIRKLWQQLLAGPNVQMTNTTLSVEVARSADLGWQYGSFQSMSADKSGKTVTQAGKYVVIWKLQPDGSWKIEADLSSPQ